MNQYRLQLTPEAEARQENLKEEHLTRYRRDYWQRYKKRHKRVYGTLTNVEYAEIKIMADNHGRSVWEEIWQQSLAYRRSSYLPPEDIRTEINKLYVELRRIGNNLNQIAHHSNTLKRFPASGNIEQQLQALENAIARFVHKPWRQR